MKAWAANDDHLELAVQVLALRGMDTSIAKCVGTENLRRLRMTIRGAVQGVGFRPFVYRLAAELGLTGWVGNTSEGVTIEAEGPEAELRDFLARIPREKPALAFLHGLEASFLDARGYTGFVIRESIAAEQTAIILPDIATCADCLAEILDPHNRRYRYPFTNCTHCGPRFSIVTGLPYDRPNTTMKKFPMCPACLAEYKDPHNRRFHAQANACPECGPQLEWWNSAGAVTGKREEALFAAATALREGKIIAVKGIGGFQLMVNARDEAAVQRLRLRKRREEKPFALMVADVAMARRECEVSALEETLLRSPEAPIVLLKRRHGAGVAPGVAPWNPLLGIMLPTSPLHHLLLAQLNFPVVATSGNISDEPICIEEKEALMRLGSIADGFLVHDRPIARHVDDSVARVMLGRESILRRARGYAPLPVFLGRAGASYLAAGGHLKNTVAFSLKDQAFISQHIGDLETPGARAAWDKVVGDFNSMYALKPAGIACDLHPGYASTAFAGGSGYPVTRVQHHYAHVLACMQENELDGTALGVAWDGTGYGLDGTIWGGEFLRVTAGGFERAAHFRTFALPGGEKAVQEPRRAALGLLYEIFADALFDRKDIPTLRAFSEYEMRILRSMLARNIQAPRTSSAGRLFDAVASILGLRHCAAFEGQAAMELEFVAQGAVTEEMYPFLALAVPGAPSCIDWEPMMHAMLQDMQREISTGIVACKFHNTLVETIVAMAVAAGEERVVLSGGCFQNEMLVRKAVQRLSQEGFRPYWHQRVPPNDGGIALGQLAAVLRLQAKEA